MSPRTNAAPTPVLLVHGFAGSGASWGAEILEGLAPRAVLAPDLPGHGGREISADPERSAIHCIVKELTRELDQRGIERADWVGYSMGGRVALAAAILRPGRVRRLVLESASPGIRDDIERAARRTEDEALAREIEVRGIEWFVEYWEARPLFTGDARLPAVERARLRSLRLRNRPESLACVLRGLGAGAQPSFWDRLGEVRAPTLLLTGAEDARYGAFGAEMEAAIPGACHLSVPGVGHGVHREDPGGWVREVVAFLGGKVDAAADIH